MADYYVKSGAAGAANGASWADAYTTIEAGAEAVSGPNNTLFASSLHSESHPSAITLALGGTPATGMFQLVSVNDSAEPPTAVQSGATVATTGASNITISGSGRVHGVSFQAGDSTSSAAIVLGNSSNSTLEFDACVLDVRGTGSSGRINVLSNSVSSVVRLVDCEFKFSNAAQYMNAGGQSTEIEIIGGQTSGSAITRLISPSSAYISFGRIVGLDMSSCAASVKIIDGTASGQAGCWTLIGLVLPASWSGSPAAVGPLSSSRVDMIDSTDGTTRYRRWIETTWGTIRDTIQLGESIYTTAGTYDGVARYSYKFAANSYANNRAGHLAGPEMSGYAEAAAAHTATVEICHDGASALTDQDVWLEVFCDGGWVSDRNANPLAAGTAQATSATAWTGDSGTGPNGSATWHTLKLVCSFTPSAAGFVMGRVVLAKASTTVYVDPILTVAAV